MTNTRTDVETTLQVMFTEKAGASLPVVRRTGGVDHVYWFWVDSSGDLYYTKSLNGGHTWETAVVVNNDAGRNWVDVAVWYDQWTPDDPTTTLIHILGREDTGDECYYFVLDASDDSWGTNNNTLVLTNPGGALIVGQYGNPSICTGTNGDIYAAWNYDATGAGLYVLRSTQASAGAAWTEIYDRLEWTPDNTGDRNIVQLRPLAGDDIMVIWNDQEPQDLRACKYDQSGDSWTEYALETSGVTQSGGAPNRWTLISAVSEQTTGDIHLVYSKGQPDGAVDQTTWYTKYSGGSWAAAKQIQGIDFTDNERRNYSEHCLTIDDDTGALILWILGGGRDNYHDRTLLRISQDGGDTWSRMLEIDDESDHMSSICAPPRILDTAEQAIVIWTNDDLNNAYSISGGTKGGLPLKRWSGVVEDDDGVAVSAGNVDVFVVWNTTGGWHRDKGMEWLGRVQIASGAYNALFIDLGNDTPEVQVAGSTATGETDATLREPWV